MGRALKVLGLLLILGSLNGCFLAPAINSFNQLGVTASDRQQLLPRQVKLLHEARYWGSSTDLMQLIDPEHPQLAQQFRAVDKGKRIVESAIDQVQFNEDSSEAKVDVRVKAYEVPVYVVKETVERQHWRFSMRDGWKVFQREELNEVS